MKLAVLYEDNHLIAVNKPAGMLVQADETGDLCLMDEVKAYLKEKYHKPGNVFLGLLHRLDRPVQGITLFAKTSKGASRVSEQIRSHRLKKIYHALVCGEPEKDSDHLIHYLRKDNSRNLVEVYKEEAADSWQAELEYEVVSKNAECALLKINLITGRPHQIRAQLSAIGCPIVGDVKYGAPQPLPDKSIALAATSLTFQLATAKEIKTLNIDIPKWP